ncbi:hypothetical protein HanHA300_Chr00c0018g0682951 [Helianthus annuus]|nr:hypothetical protein HanHA89_Chr16g0659121 [Helianthus annuus]KAJ0638915.1 hypothetical protein HanHA300_Chr00c0018g0682951 [Helianthus annuus]
MKYNSLKHNTFIPFQQYPFYPNPPHPIFGRPTKPKNFISNFKSRALFHFRFLSPSKIWICSSFLLSLFQIPPGSAGSSLLWFQRCRWWCHGRGSQQNNFGGTLEDRR